MSTSNATSEAAPGPRKKELQCKADDAPERAPMEGFKPTLAKEFQSIAANSRERQESDVSIIFAIILGDPLQRLSEQPLTEFRSSIEKNTSIFEGRMSLKVAYSETTSAFAIREAPGSFSKGTIGIVGSKEKSPFTWEGVIRVCKIESGCL